VVSELEATTALVESGTVWGGEARPEDVLAQCGGRLGRYRLDAVLGRGGMGVVYAAFDPALDRAVALKVMRFGRGGSSSPGDSQARMLREAQALAGLAHPNVVTIYDVGRVEDRVYMAMELVEGQTLERWMKAGPHSWRRVARVMLEAGRGLVAAHRQGLVHRDFKPANVLIGADGRVRVADFGLARSGTSVGRSRDGRGFEGAWDSAESHSSRLPVLTEAGTVMGTPGYMAPEQVAGEQVDTRSDQFAFCVTFYQALYGHRPHEGVDRREVLRNARLGKVRDPPAQRRVPARLRRLIVRGLSPDPDARWDDLEQLLTRIEGQLRWRPASSIWMVGTGVVFAVAAGMSLISWIAADPCAGVADEMHAVWNAERRSRVAVAFASSEVVHAADTWARVSDRLDAQAARWVEAREDACRSPDADAAARDETVACLAHRRAELATLVEVLATPDEETVRGAAMATAGLQPISDCEHALRFTRGVPPPPDHLVDQVRQLREQLASVAVYRDIRRFDRALEIGGTVLRAADELGHEPLRAEALYRHGRTLSELGEYTNAAEHMENAFYVALEAGHDTIAAEAASSLFFVHAYRRGDRDAAARWLGQAESATARTGLAGGNARWRLANDRGTVAIRDAEYEVAQALLTRALELAREHYGGDNLQTASVVGNLGVVELSRGDLDAARRSFETALAISDSLVGSEHPRRASWFNNLGVIEQNQGNHEASLEYFANAYEIESVIFDDAHPNVGMSLNNIGGALAHLGRDLEAKEYFERSIAVYERAESFDPLDRARPVGNLGRTHSVLGEHTRGIERLREAIRIIEEATGPEHPDLGPHCINLGAVYLRIGEHEEALVQMQRALEIDRRVLGSEHPFVASTLASMGEVHEQLGRHALATELLEQALSIQEREAVDVLNLAATRFALARALWPERGQRTRATQLLALAQEALEGAGAAGADRLADLRTWRANN
jgi:eukaryotic-like serine/threonine-protein kinase